MPTQEVMYGDITATQHADWREDEQQRFGQRVERNGQETLAQALGWLSVGVGLAEVLAPRRIARLAGMPEYPTLLRIMGAREIASGIGILTQREPAGWLWARVAGDAADLTMLGLALGSSESDGRRIAMASAAVAGVTALDVVCAQKLTERTGSALGVHVRDGAVQVRKSIAVNKSPEEVYRFWRDFQSLPRFMKHLESVHVTGDGRSHWVAKAPVGTVEWDAEITEDRPNELIAWQSVEGADIENRGAVRFERGPGGRGTLVRVELDYRPPAGVAGSLVAKLFGEEPEQQVKDDLHRFKQFIETGEIPTTEGQSSGRRAKKEERRRR